MSDRPLFWFPAKRYGWGWGLPVRWQGWVVFAVYAVFLYGGIYYLKEQAAPLPLLIYVTALTAVLIAIMAAKGERPARWRWGKRIRIGNARSRTADIGRGVPHVERSTL